MTKDGVQRKLPPKLAKEFGPELSIPATRIFNSISQKGSWPARWKIEHGVPLNKVQPKQPTFECELRIMSLPAFLSKTCEKRMMYWLLHFIGSKIYTDQYGGIRGKSIVNYLINMKTFLLTTRTWLRPEVF